MRKGVNWVLDPEMFVAPPAQVKEAFKWTSVLQKYTSATARVCSMSQLYGCDLNLANSLFRTTYRLLGILYSVLRRHSHRSNIHVASCRLYVVKYNNYNYWTTVCTTSIATTVHDKLEVSSIVDRNYNKKLIRRWDRECELSLRRHRTRST